MQLFGERFVCLDISVANYRASFAKQLEVNVHMLLRW